MSPAPQANLEVERYIGSYLISQRVPPNANKSSAGNKRYQNHHVKQKSADVEKPRNFNKYCFSQREHHVGGGPGPGPGRYSMPPVPLECQGYPYGKGWAGVPLISMTSGNHRRNKKSPSIPNAVQAHKFSQKQYQQNNYSCKDTTGLEENAQSDANRSPLTRLAIHTQGAPLIQAGRYGNNNNRCRNNFGRDPATRVYRGEAAHWDPAKEAKTAAAVQNKDQACGNTDSLSVASDESSGNSENSLPRIIKPRKRRKKDRKPITTAANTLTPSPSNETSHFMRESEQILESTALKSFLPCFDHAASSNANDHKSSDLLSDINNLPSVEEKQSEDLIDPLASADEFPLGNLLDDEEDKGSDDSEVSSATLCQCRYCDPSGVIWDVDQRCYSPFLTPPSPTDSKMHFGSPSPLAFPRSYNRQIGVVESPPSPYSFDCDLGSLLRRSWSVPSYDKPLVSSDKQNSRPSSPVGLQVSSEIVTSPNGHRDIEIKFYSSSSPPSESSKVKFSACERDRCFFAEE